RGGLDYSRGVARPGDVGVVHEGTAAESLALGCRLLEGVATAGNEHEVRTATREGVRGGAPDPARCAGDDDDVTSPHGTPRPGWTPPRRARRSGRRACRRAIPTP